MTIVDRYISWGRMHRYQHQLIKPLWSKDAIASCGLAIKGSRLAYGMGRSYGDSCLNEGEHLIVTDAMRKILSFDSSKGIIHCECGVTVGEIIEHVLPHGWFPAVVAGTKFVTLGGAIANDIHGKNHHIRGSFGNHVTEITLMRSTGELEILKPEDSMFAATVGGLGLTGLILDAKIQLMPVASTDLLVEYRAFENFNQYISMHQEADRDFEYTVSWLDAGPRSGNDIRGILMCGRHTDNGTALPTTYRFGPIRRSFPFDPGFSFINPFSIRIFNSLYYFVNRRKTNKMITQVDPYFFPLDGIRNWNLAYGVKGFLQYQFQVPNGRLEIVQEFIQRCRREKHYSFLCVLKTFGSIPAKGMLSFPSAGPTLAIDFANSGPDLFSFLDSMDKLIIDAGGRLYPAKDSRMSAFTFQSSFPRWEEFIQLADPNYSSSFAKRVGLYARSIS